MARRKRSSSSGGYAVVHVKGYCRRPAVPLWRQRQERDAAMPF